MLFPPVGEASPPQLLRQDTVVTGFCFLRPLRSFVAIVLVPFIIRDLTRLRCEPLQHLCLHSLEVGGTG